MTQKTPHYFRIVQRTEYHGRRTSKLAFKIKQQGFHVVLGFSWRS